MLTARKLETLFVEALLNYVLAVDIEPHVV